MGNKTRRAVPGHKYRIGFGANQFDKILDAADKTEKHPNIFVKDAGLELAEAFSVGGPFGGKGR